MSLLISVAVVFLCVCALLFVTQRSQIYFRTPETDLPGAEVVRLRTDGATLKLWVVRRPGSSSLIYFGGNAENVAGSVDELAAAFPEHTLFLVNYRGYGGSTGRPSERALEGDALAVHAHVAAAYAQVDVMGRSLGSAVGAYLASERPVRRLVLVTPFDSLVNVARGHLWWLPVGLLMLDRYETARLAPRISAPVLMVVAGDDEIVPRARSDALAAAFRRGQVRVEVVRGATHNSLDLFPAYLVSVRTFLRES